MRYWSLKTSMFVNGAMQGPGSIIVLADDALPPRRSVTAASAGGGNPQDEDLAIECDPTGKPLSVIQAEQEAAAAQPRASATDFT